MPAIEVQAISKSYGAIQALRGVSFTVDKGEVIGLLGPNGAGKSTLMKILTGYIEPDEGNARVQDLDVVADPLAAQRRIGYLPESAPLYGEMLVQEYLDMMAALRGVADGERRARLAEAVRATGLVDRMTQPIATLSKGYRQRVGIAQAIIHRPDVLILDEPTNGLDPTQIAEIRALIQRLAQRTTVLLSTHILSEVEATCERVVVIMNGTLRADAKLAELRAANAAIIAVDKAAKDVAATLRKLDDVATVDSLGHEDGWQRFRVTAAGAQALTPRLFDAARANDWRLAELRPDPKTLESVFRDLAATPGQTTGKASQAVAS